MPRVVLLLLVPCSMVAQVGTISGVVGVANRSPSDHGAGQRRVQLSRRRSALLGRRDDHRGSAVTENGRIRGLQMVVWPSVDQPASCRRARTSPADESPRR